MIIIPLKIGPLKKAYVKEKNYTNKFGTRVHVPSHFNKRPPAKAQERHVRKRFFDHSETSAKTATEELHSKIASHNLNASNAQKYLSDLKEDHQDNSGLSHATKKLHLQQEIKNQNTHAESLKRKVDHIQNRWDISKQQIGTRKAKSRASRDIAKTDHSDGQKKTLRNIHNHYLSDKTKLKPTGKVQTGRDHILVETRHKDTGAIKHIAIDKNGKVHDPKTIDFKPVRKERPKEDTKGPISLDALKEASKRSDKKVDFKKGEKLSYSRKSPSTGSVRTMTGTYDGEGNIKLDKPLAGRDVIPVSPYWEKAEKPKKPEPQDTRSTTLLGNKNAWKGGPKDDPNSKTFNTQSEYMDWYRDQSEDRKDDHKLNKKDGKLIVTWGDETPDEKISLPKKEEPEKSDFEKFKARSEGMKGNKNAYKGGPKEDYKSRIPRIKGYEHTKGSKNQDIYFDVSQPWPNPIIEKGRYKGSKLSEVPKGYLKSFLTTEGVYLSENKVTQIKFIDVRKGKSRSDVMMGNKNAYKGGPKEVPKSIKKTVDEIKDHIKKAEKITDFGEKIGGARKDQWKDKYLEGKDLADLNDREILKHVKRDKIWPKPDYDQMIKDGTDPVVAYLMNEVRAKLPATFKIPQNKTGQMKGFAKHYVELVERTREAVLKLKKPEDFNLKGLMGEIFHDEYKETGFTGSNWQPKRGEPSKMYFTTNRFLKSFRVSPWDVKRAKDKVDKGWGLSDPWKKGVTVSKASDGYVLNVGVFDAYNGNPHKTEKDALDFAKLRYEALKGLEVHESNRLLQDKNGEPLRDKNGDQKTEKSFYVTKGYSILVEENTREKLEKKIIESHLKEGPKKSNRRQKFVRPQLKGIERTGTDHRKGKEAKTDNFVDTFGFRGGEFGNWNTQADRQQNLNHAHDAFMDLADVLGLDPKEIALKGDLSIAFGARGQGSASAHYEPARKVINLTKMKGSGSLAHEWGHAFDDYLMKSTGAQVSGASGMATESHKNLDNLLPNGSGAAFEDILTTMNQRTLSKEDYIAVQDKKIARSQQVMKSWLDSVRTRLTQEGSGRKSRVATGAELKEFDEKIVPSILSGKSDKRLPDGKKKWDTLPEPLHYLTNVFYNKIKGHNEDYSKKSLNASFSRIEFHESLKKDLKPNLMKADSKFYEGAVASQAAFAGKTGYWTSKVEMFARAFESYVHDKISDKGEKSQYLVHSTNNDAYKIYQMEGGAIPKPYPEGDERIAINKAFDTFFSKLKKDKSLPDHKEPLKKSIRELAQIKLLKAKRTRRKKRANKR